VIACTCGCGKSLADAQVVEIAKIQELDLPKIRAGVTEHQAYTILCACGKIHKADFPDGINASVQYGSGIKALSTYLIVQQLLPFFIFFAFTVLHYF
jgi:transposase